MIIHSFLLGLLLSQRVVGEGVVDTAPSYGVHFEDKASK